MDLGFLVLVVEDCDAAAEDDWGAPEVSTATAEEVETAGFSMTLVASSLEPGRPLDAPWADEEAADAEEDEPEAAAEAEVDDEAAEDDEAAAVEEATAEDEELPLG